MNGNYYRLLVFVTLKLPQESNDVTLQIVRTVPFQPVEGMELVITNDDSEEYEITLGPPRYEFAESSFVEYQEDESLLEYLREGEYTLQTRTELINYYKSFGFQEIKPKVVMEQARQLETA